MLRLLVVLGCVFLQTGILSAQTPVYTVYHAAHADTMFQAFSARKWAMVHYQMPDSIAPNNLVDLNAPLAYVAQFGQRMAHTRPVLDSHQRDYDRVNDAYDSREYDTAAERATVLVMDDPENPFFIDAYARTLFRIPERRSTGRDVYMRLMEILDGQVALGDSVVPIDVHFLEAYGKLAALHLDAEAYDSAAFESTRALIAAYHSQAPEAWQFIDLQLSQLTEAYAELGKAPLARWFGGAALRWNPANQPVLPYLRQVGPKSERIVNCTYSEGSQPGEGNYTLALAENAEGAALQCVAPAQDRDGTIGPCLRIGEVFVGIGEAEVYSSIGQPIQSVTMEDGTEAHMHLLFNNLSTGAGAYYVIQYEELNAERIVSSIQLSGQSPPITYSCSCIELGSPADAVARQFGQPTSVEEFELEGSDLKGDLWSYEPNPFTVEIVNGVVRSIKVWRPNDIPAQRRRPSLLYRP
jgi:hypothetical protein